VCIKSLAEDDWETPPESKISIYERLTEELINGGGHGWPKDALKRVRPCYEMLGRVQYDALLTGEKTNNPPENREVKSQPGTCQTWITSGGMSMCDTAVSFHRKNKEDNVDEMPVVPGDTINSQSVRHLDNQRSARNTTAEHFASLRDQAALHRIEAARLDQIADFGFEELNKPVSALNGGSKGN